MTIRLATAPCSWGVEDAANSSNPPWETVLKEASFSGFSGLELGPLGFFPQNADLIADVFTAHKLLLVAGTLYDDILHQKNFSSIKSKTHEICNLISAVNANGRGEQKYLVIIDSVKEERDHTAGQSTKAPRLNSDDWKIMMTHVKEVSRIASEGYGIRPVIHPHAGGYLEFDDETERFLNDIADETTGLCLDTGHLYYSGVAPDRSIIKYSNRLNYLHFKDINLNLLQKTRSVQQGFFDSCLEGVMCPVGTGCIDYKSVKRALEQINYIGWITIEQERDPLKFEGALADLKLSNRFLSKIGF